MSSRLIGCLALSLSVGIAACDGVPDDGGAIGARTPLDLIIPYDPYSISLEAATIATGLTEGRLTFPLHVEGSYEYPYINPHLWFGSTGTKSLQMTLPKRNLVNGQYTNPDRTEVDVYNMAFFNDPIDVKFGFRRPKYFGFAMYIHPTSDLDLGSGVHFMQAWQQNCDCGVPLHLTLLPNTYDAATQTMRFQARLRDDAGTYDPVSKTRLPEGTDTPITVGQWHTFVFYLDPDNNANLAKADPPNGIGVMKSRTGTIKVWFDGKPLIDWTHDWGCNPTKFDRWDPQHPDLAVRDEWTVRAGLYRTEAGSVQKVLHVFFDNLGFGNTYDQVDPNWKPPIIH
jgi:hypothetical protein